jgi:acyl dehydratase
MEGPVKSVSIDEMSGAVGKEMGVSAWTLIDQPMVDAFAKLTGDTYFIHTNPERAKKETPFGGSIAHGFLTMSLLANMAYQAAPGIRETKTGVNYGFNRLRFVAPVPTGSRVRGRFVLQAFDRQPARWQATYNVSIEIEGASKPAIVAEWVTAGLL